MLFLSTLFFAMALSFDGFGVGVAYGVRKIKIPVISLLVISATSAISIGLSMLAGHFFSTIISVKAAERIGASILICVGIWVIIQPWLQRNNKTKETIKTEGIKNIRPKNLPKEPFVLHIKPLGLVIQILREPSAADIDLSGTINAVEAFFLGLALAMDAFGAGFGAAIAGFTSYLTPFVVGMFCFIFVNLGDYLGRRYAPGWLGAKAAIIPGWVLIIIGIMNMR